MITRLQDLSTRDISRVGHSVAQPVTWAAAEAADGDGLGHLRPHEALSVAHARSRRALQPPLGFCVPGRGVEAPHQVLHGRRQPRKAPGMGSSHLLLHCLQVVQNNLRDSFTTI